MGIVNNINFGWKLNFVFLCAHTWSLRDLHLSPTYDSLQRQTQKICFDKCNYFLQQ